MLAQSIEPRSSGALESEAKLLVFAHSSQTVVDMKRVDGRCFLPGSTHEPSGELNLPNSPGYDEAYASRSHK